MIATIAERFFFSAITEILATVRKPAFIFSNFRLFTRASILDPVVHLLQCQLSVTRQIVYMSVPFGSIIHSFKCDLTCTIHVLIFKIY